MSCPHAFAACGHAGRAGPDCCSQACASSGGLRSVERMFERSPDGASEPAGSAAEQLPSWLAHLNAEQRRAATHAGGPLLVLAGAGTGKTTTLCARVAWLLSEGGAAGR